MDNYYIQGVSKVRGHFKKSILHPDFLHFLPFSYRHEKILFFINFQNYSMSRIKKLLEINISPPNGANLCRVCFGTFPSFLSVFSSN